MAAPDCGELVRRLEKQPRTGLEDTRLPRRARPGGTGDGPGPLIGRHATGPLRRKPTSFGRKIGVGSWLVWWVPLIFR